MGAWIEIQIVDGQAPSDGVAPLVGAWIEIYMVEVQTTPHHCRSSRGSVD